MYMVEVFHSSEYKKIVQGKALMVDEDLEKCCEE